MTPAQLCSHSQLPRACLAPGFPISTYSCCQPQPLPLYMCSSVCLLAISRGSVGTLGEKSKGQCPNSTSNSVRPFPCPPPCNCHKGATGASPVGDKMRICSLVLLSTLRHRGAHSSAWSMCWNLGVEPESDRWVRGRMKTGRAWQRIQVPKLESQPRRKGRL